MDEEEEEAKNARHHPCGKILDGTCVARVMLDDVSCFGTVRSDGGAVAWV
jgi:hypothetical protein